MADVSASNPQHDHVDPGVSTRGEESGTLLPSNRRPLWRTARHRLGGKLSRFPITASFKRSRMRICAKPVSVVLRADAAGASVSGGE
ncbi:hypothetical protein [Methylobacterium nigriterrae]|uniref:hypothetical protein n=1 Tax=Methylobacterium nigriterrae TaxID=3127512 RepID=UPI0030140408